MKLLVSETLFQLPQFLYLWTCWPYVTSLWCS